MTTIWRSPSMSVENSQLIPPMWVNGKTSALRSSAVSSSAVAHARRGRLIVPSVCWAPLGSAVVPDV